MSRDLTWLADLIGYLTYGLPVIGVILKLTGVISWDWWLILSPILALGIVLAVLLFLFRFFAKAPGWIDAFMGMLILLSQAIANAAVRLRADVGAAELKRRYDNRIDKHL
ncbi:hypothetical protein GF420_05490 [candidate division GN15 bacterium]|nr:hypothetical protein [candidate division GN15 bacterium]